MTFSGGVWYYRVRVRVMHLFRVRVNPKQIYFKHKKKILINLVIMLELIHC